MNFLTNIIAAGAPAEGGFKFEIFQLQSGMVFWTWTCFIIFLILLWKFGWGPILKALDEREAKIKKSLDDADAASSALEDASAKQQELISSAQKEATDIVNSAREAAKNVASDVESKAREEANRLIEDAKKTIETEKQQAIGAIRQEAADLAISAATKLINSNLDDAKNRELVESHITELTS